MGGSWASVGYTVGNLVLRRRASGAVKRDFRSCIRRYTSPNQNVEYGYPHSNALLQFCLKLERCIPQKGACHLTKYDVYVIYDDKLLPTLSNQTSRYKSKYIRIDIYDHIIKQGSVSCDRSPPGHFKVNN